MDSNIRTQVILAAVNAAGPADVSGWEGAVTDLAGRIALMLNDNSAQSKRITEIAEARIFRANVLKIKKEERSKRGVVLLETGTARKSKSNFFGQEVPLGQEILRTERTDDPAGLAMAKRVQSLVGHHVTIWMKVESFVSDGESKTSRVLVHIEDNGPAKDLSS